jgi:hypothetical protein
MKKAYPNQVCFAIGTGRCGTKFFYQLLKKESQIASHHERHPLSDTFERYCRWNDLPIDDAGFLAIKERGILEDLTHFQLSFEASAYLSLSLLSLYQTFDAKFIFLTRSPHKVVNSYLQKDWYAQDIIRKDLEKASDFQPDMKERHHSFSRLTPRGPEVKDWIKLSRVGKLAWFWRIINEAILEQLKYLPKSHYKIIRIEDLTYEKYAEVAAFLNFEPEVSAEHFTKLTSSRPNHLYPTKRVVDWSEQERAEFEREVKELSELWGYPWKTDQITDKEEKAPQTEKRNSIYVKYQAFRKNLQMKKKLIRFIQDF